LYGEVYRRAVSVFEIVSTVENGRHEDRNLRDSIADLVAYNATQAIERWIARLLAFTQKDSSP
jgi:hypothetical protein